MKQKNNTTAEDVVNTWVGGYIGPEEIKAFVPELTDIVVSAVSRKKMDKETAAYIAAGVIFELNKVVRRTRK